MSATLTDADFDALARTVLSSIEAHVDRWLQDDQIDIDARRTGGMLELLFPDRSQIVVNTQPPLRELWIAAKSGGRHFHHRAGRWLDTRDGTEFFTALSTHASEQAGQTLVFSPP